MSFLAFAKPRVFGRQPPPGALRWKVPDYFSLCLGKSLSNMPSDPPLDACPGPAALKRRRRSALGSLHKPQSAQCGCE